MQIIADVPALKVKFVVAPAVKAVALDRVTVLLPRFIALVKEPVVERVAAVILKLFVVNVPCVTSIVPEDVTASPSVTVMPLPLIVTGPSVLPA